MQPHIEDFVGKYVVTTKELIHKGRKVPLGTIFHVDNTEGFSHIVTTFLNERIVIHARYINILRKR